MVLLLSHILSLKLNPEDLFFDGSNMNPARIHCIAREKDVHGGILGIIGGVFVPGSRVAGKKGISRFCKKREEK